MTNDTLKKKYVLKPGLHQFAPGSAAIHSNENLSDEEAEWYLQRYPHIAALFAPQPPKGGVMEPETVKQAENTHKSIVDNSSDKGGSI
ncbi:hypothetical protein [Mucilaginibacter sp.]|uniref:hypothetical protein n=1 Tax=Mucilaginibacter sp. TaxID=1882438 RepID=UPI002ED510DF